MTDEEFKLTKEDYRIALMHLTEARKVKGLTKAECVLLAEKAYKLDKGLGYPESMCNEAKRMRLQAIEEVYSEDETETVTVKV